MGEEYEKLIPCIGEFVPNLPFVSDTYCWMYSTFEIPNEYKGQCNSGDTEDIAGLAIYNSYYQWVPLYLLVSAVFFYIPRFVARGYHLV